MGNPQKHFDKMGVHKNFWSRYIVPAVIKIRGNRCEKCGGNERLCVHHKDYDIQTLDQLEVLCFICHMKHHREEDRKKGESCANPCGKCDLDKPFVCMDCESSLKEGCK